MSSIRKIRRRIESGRAVIERKVVLDPFMRAALARCRVRNPDLGNSAEDIFQALRIIGVLTPESTLNDWHLIEDWKNTCRRYLNMPVVEESTKE
jgi:hypothetical protein